MNHDTQQRTICVIDFETASSDPASACSVGWSFLSEDHNGAWNADGESWERYVRPPRNHQVNTQYHKIKASKTVDRPSFRQVWEQDVYPMLLDHKVDRLLSHNARFDAAVLWCSLLGDESERQMTPLFIARRLLLDHAGNEWRMGCTLRAAYDLIPDRPRGGYKLEALAQEFGVTLDNAHEAKYDALATAQIGAILLNQSDDDFDDLMLQARGLFKMSWLGPTPLWAGNKSKETGWQNLLWGVHQSGAVDFPELRRQRLQAQQQYAHAA